MISTIYSEDGKGLFLEIRISQTLSFNHCADISRLEKNKQFSSAKWAIESTCCISNISTHLVRDEPKYKELWRYVASFCQKVCVRMRLTWFLSSVSSSFVSPVSARCWTPSDAKPPYSQIWYETACDAPVMFEKRTSHSSENSTECQLLGRLIIG